MTCSALTTLRSSAVVSARLAVRIADLLGRFPAKFALPLPYVAMNPYTIRDRRRAGPRRRIADVEVSLWQRWQSAANFSGFGSTASRSDELVALDALQHLAASCALKMPFGLRCSLWLKRSVSVSPEGELGMAVAEGGDVRWASRTRTPALTCACRSVWQPRLRVVHHGQPRRVRMLGWQEMHGGVTASVSACGARA